MPQARTVLRPCNACFHASASDSYASCMRLLLLQLVTLLCGCLNLCVCCLAALLQMMLPNEHFVEWVQSGQAAGKVDLGALQRLAAAASCG